MDEESKQILELLCDLLTIGALLGSLTVFCKKHPNGAPSCCTVPWNIVKAILAIEGIVSGCLLVQDWESTLVILILSIVVIVIIIICVCEYDWSSPCFDLLASCVQIVFSSLEISKSQNDYVYAIAFAQMLLIIFSAVSYWLNFCDSENGTACSCCWTFLLHKESNPIFLIIFLHHKTIFEFI